MSDAARFFSGFTSFQRAAQFGSGPVQPRRDRPGGAIQDFGDLGVVQPGLIFQDEDDTVFEAEVREGGGYVCLGGRGRAVVRPSGCFGSRGFKACPLPVPAAEELEGLVDGDAVEPGSRGRAGVEVCELLKCAEERILRQVEGIFRTVGHAEGQGVNAVGVLLIKHPLSGAVAAPTPFDHRGFVHP